MNAPEALTPLVRNHLMSEDNSIYFSVATGWEIAIKHSLGRLRLPLSPPEFVNEAVERHGLTVMNAELSHVMSAGGLPGHHKDPFDRLLIGQAQVEGLKLVTPDIAFKPYAVETIW
ncbi:PilT protein domain protein [Rhodospirillaceae bacterium LM-1]|jgi:PIN domain nuclease of toxin-antitoxin system|nr:PilT protein domain protein [Rhodospirillaceae bacterium LM-1]